MPRLKHEEIEAAQSGIPGCSHATAETAQKHYCRACNEAFDSCEKCGDYHAKAHAAEVAKP